MKELKIDVMGCPYKVLVGKADEIHIDRENMGECRTWGKKILVKTDKEDCKKRELEERTRSENTGDSRPRNFSHLFKRVWS